MAEQLLAGFESQIVSLKLITGKGGAFEVVVDGDLVYSNPATGSHAEYEDVAGPIRARS